MKIFFVRHGQTNYNVLGLCNEMPNKDVKLTEKGVKQAEEVSDKLKDTTIDLVITSELFRTIQTANIITNNNKIQAKVEARLNDTKTGIEGQKVSDYLESIKKDPIKTRPKNGESFLDYKKRVYEFLNDLKELDYETILVVAHCDTLKIINGYFNKLSDKEMYNTTIHNCQVLEFEI